MNVDDGVRERLYAGSPHELGSYRDEKFRDYIDERLEANIVVEVEGGVVQHVIIQDAVAIIDDQSYSVVDWDDIKGGDAY